MDDKIDQHEVAKYLGVSTRTIRALIRRSELPPPIRIGRRQFWLKDNFTSWLRDGAASKASLRHTSKFMVRGCGTCPKFTGRR